MHVTYIHTDQDIDGAVGKQDAVESFQSLGEATESVIMRLSTKLPRIRVKRVRGRLGEESKSPSR